MSGPANVPPLAAGSRWPLASVGAGRGHRELRFNRGESTRRWAYRTITDPASAIRRAPAARRRSLARARGARKSRRSTVTVPTVGPPDGSGQWFTDLAVQSYVNPSRATGFHVPKRASRVANAIALGPW